MFVYFHVTVLQHQLELGDEIKIDGHAPFLKIFDPVMD